MWVPTEAEAVEMFARYFEAHYRSGVVERARETAGIMRSKGDYAGHKIWNDVAERVAHLRRTERVVRRRHFERA